MLKNPKKLCGFARKKAIAQNTQRSHKVTQRKKFQVSG